MRAFKDNKFGERATTAADAKRALLEKFKARPKADDPAMLELQATRMAVAEAREVRNQERKAAKEAEAARLAAEAAAKLVAEEAMRVEEAKRLEEQRAREEAAKAERKAMRDAKYAARKARR